MRSIERRFLMNRGGLIALVFVSFLHTLEAQERPAQFDASKTTLPEWSVPKWEELLEPKPARLTLGKSDFVMSGALVETFRAPPRSSGDRTLAQKFLSLPIVNMFVPGPMPKVGQGGKYFAWGGREESWSVVSARPASGPQGVLISAATGEPNGRKRSGGGRVAHRYWAEEGETRANCCAPLLVLGKDPLGKNGANIALADGGQVVVPATTRKTSSPRP